MIFKRILRKLEKNTEVVFVLVIQFKTTNPVYWALTSKKCKPLKNYNTEMLLRPTKSWENVLTEAKTQKVIAIEAGGSHDDLYKSM